jgi:hypothetical protein
MNKQNLREYSVKLKPKKFLGQAILGSSPVHILKQDELSHIDHLNIPLGNLPDSV